MTWLALDIGGANVKAADGRGWCRGEPLALWRHPQRLADTLSGVIAAAPACHRLAVTMTGELADCFATKAEGVRAILEAVAQAAAGREVAVYLTDGRLVPPDAALDVPLAAAASNWHALACATGRFCRQGTGLLVDVGSTTSDLIPLVDRRPAALGRTDPERLAEGELVYAGVTRTPLCALIEAFQWSGRRCPLAREVFATTWDAYLVLGALPEAPDRSDTADGRPATVDCALVRLARSICADTTLASRGELLRAAEHVAARQCAELQAAMARVCSRLGEPPATIVIAGQGEFVARRAAERFESARIVSLAQEWGPQASQAAPAHALALLAHQRDRES